MVYESHFNNAVTWKQNCLARQDKALISSLERQERSGQEFKVILNYIASLRSAELWDSASKQNSNKK